MPSQNTASNSINDIYYKLGCVIAILSHNDKEIDITQFDVLNKILPAIRMDNIFICFNKNNHPVAFLSGKSGFRYARNRRQRLNQLAPLPRLERRRALFGHSLCIKQ